jgi:hypothetical protein
MASSAGECKDLANDTRQLPSAPTGAQQESRMTEQRGSGSPPADCAAAAESLEELVGR